MHVPIRRLRVVVHEWPEGTRPTVSAAHLEPITLSNAHRVCEFRPERTALTFQRFLERGDFGLFAINENSVVGHAWMSAPRPQSHRGQGYVPLAEGESLIFYCNVATSHRGRGIFKAMISGLAAQHLQRGDQARLLIDTEISNAPSRRGIIGAGFRPVEELDCLMLGSRLLWSSRRPARAM